MQAPESHTPQTIRLEQLRAKITTLELDDPTATLQFSKRLEREQFSWSTAFTHRVLEEYRRYLVLLALTDRELTPSEAVDQAWHLHIVYTRSYHEWCAALFGAYLHHGPTKGGWEAQARYLEQYNVTLAFYEDVFGVPPPKDIWPPAEMRFNPKERSAWIQTNAFWMVSKTAARRLTVVTALIVACATFGMLANHYGFTLLEDTYAQSRVDAEDEVSKDTKSAMSAADKAVVVIFGTVIAVGLIGVIAQVSTADGGKRENRDGGCSGWFGCGGGDGCGGGGCGGCGG